MRRISDGIKVSVRYKTTDQCERAFVETVPYTFLYEDGDGYVFMNPNNYEQVTVPRDILGDQSVYMQENMECMLSLHNGIPIAIELPARVTLEVVETEPVVKGQTAASSFKPALLSNGVRTPRCHRISSGHPHRGDDRGRPYVERAKDGPPTPMRDDVSPAYPGVGTFLLTVLAPFGFGYFLSYLYRAVNAVAAPTSCAISVSMRPASAFSRPPISSLLPPFSYRSESCSTAMGRAACSRR